MTMRRRIEVNLEELDQIIDRGRQAPLSESEGQKLKTAIHAMAERPLLSKTLIDPPRTGGQVRS